MKFFETSYSYNWKIGQTNSGRTIWRCNFCNKFMSCNALVGTLTTADWKINPPPYKCPHCKQGLLK